MTSSARPRLDALTSLRFFAAALVLLVHLKATGLMTGGPAWFQAVASVGYLGVSFFFVLSGFILVYTYFGRDFSAREFWQARFARVYPAYAASLIAALPMFAWVLIHLDFPFLAWAKEHLSLTCLMVATLAQAWVPQIASAWDTVGWSLSVESFFYLCFPLLFLLFSKTGKRGLAVLAIAAFAVTMLVTGGYVALSPDGVPHTTDAYENLFWLTIVRFNPLVRLPEFVIGMAAGFAFVKMKAAPNRGTWLVIAGLGGFAAAVAFVEKIPYPMLHSGLLAPVFSAIIFGVALRPNWTRLLHNRWLVLLGDASYSLYLLHFTIIWAAIALFGRAAATPMSCLLIAAASIVASLASYKFVEQPARRYLRTMKLRELQPATA